MAKLTASERYLRDVAAAAIRMVRLEAKDHSLLSNGKLMYTSIRGRTIMDRHQELWLKVTQARADLKTKVAAAQQGSGE